MSSRKSSSTPTTNSALPNLPDDSTAHEGLILFHLSLPFEFSSLILSSLFFIQLHFCLSLALAQAVIAAPLKVTGLFVYVFLNSLSYLITFMIVLSNSSRHESR